MRRRWTLIGLGTALLMTAIVPTSPVDAGLSSRPVRVMTRNLYLGADISNVAAATSFEELAAITTRNFAMVQATDFPARATLLADEIADADPDLIGLQEVSLYRIGPVGLLDGPATPATVVVYDWLQLLQDALVSRGLNYRVAAIQAELDAEIPSTLGYDIRITQRDVILAKSSPEIRVTNAMSANYSNNLGLPTIAGEVPILRGWTSVDATVNRRTFRFVNTHLEAYSSWHRVAQATELIMGPANSALPVVVVGDLNALPDAADTSDGYATFVAGGFTDAWRLLHPGVAGPTCCYSENLIGGTLTDRIDYVMSPAAATVLSARLTGISSDELTPSGLSPSDHAGLVVSLTL